MNNQWKDRLEENRQRYRELCKKEKSICIFLKDYWQDAVCENGQWSAVFYEKDDTILGSLVFCYRKKTRGIEIFQPILTQVSGVWIKSCAKKTTSRRLEYEKEVFTGLILELERLPIINFRQNFTVELTNWLPFYWKGYHQTTRYTYRILDISNAEFAISQFSKTKRRDLNCALKQGLDYKFDLSAQDFYALLVRSYAARGQRLVYSYQQFKRIYDTMYSYDCGKTIYAIDKQGILYAAELIVFDEKCAFDLIGTYDYDMRKSGADTFLVAEMIRYLSEKGIQEFDFEGSMVESIESGYRLYGTEQLPYFMIFKDFYKTPLDWGYDKVESGIRKCMRKGMNIVDRYRNKR